jgi:hypothetical protein
MSKCINPHNKGRYQFDSNGKLLLITYSFYLCNFSWFTRPFLLQTHSPRFSGFMISSYWIHLSPDSIHYRYNSKGNFSVFSCVPTSCSFAPLFRPHALILSNSSLSPDCIHYQYNSNGNLSVLHYFLFHAHSPRFSDCTISFYRIHLSRRTSLATDATLKVIFLFLHSFLFHAHSPCFLDCTILFDSHWRPAHCHFAAHLSSVNADVQFTQSVNISSYRDLMLECDQYRRISRHLDWTSLIHQLL